MAKFAVTDPATSAVVGTVEDLSPEQAAAQVGAAQAAFEQWREASPRHRAEVLMRAYEGMHAQKERLRDLIVAENGKSQVDAAAEVNYAAEFFRWYAEEAVRPAGDYAPAPAGGVRNVVTRHPVGVAVLITPWNFPAAMATRKIGPALAAGCAVLLKPAAETPLTALAVAEILSEAGAPEGLVQIATTTDSGGVVSAWLADERVRKLSFTGSTRVGRILLGQCAERVVNTSMELGGNAPFIVTEDADLDAAVAGAMVAKFRNGGQACTAANRFYVHEAVAEEFTAKFGVAIEALNVGDAAEGAEIGPVISAQAAVGIRELIDGAVAEGAEVAHRAELPQGLAETFVAPQLLTGVPGEAAILREEIFRAGGAGGDLERGAGGHRAGQRCRGGPGLLCLCRGPEAGHADRRTAGGRHGRHQSRHRLRSLGALRRGEAGRHRPRGRQLRDGGVHRAAVPGGGLELRQERGTDRLVPAVPEDLRPHSVRLLNNPVICGMLVEKQRLRKAG